LFPPQTIEERLSVVHVQAIAARVGVMIFNSDLDYGVDGTFRAINSRGNRQSVRIRIPRAQQFIPAALLQLLDANRNYANNGVWECQ
jgi:hypothetical protein